MATLADIAERGGKTKKVYRVGIRMGCKKRDRGCDAGTECLRAEIYVCACMCVCVCVCVCVGVGGQVSGPTREESSSFPKGGNKEVPRR